MGTFRPGWSELIQKQSDRNRTSPEENVPLVVLQAQKARGATSRQNHSAREQPDQQDMCSSVEPHREIISRS
ncbi:MAG: hypothetical protein AMXMBFR13_19320 [Phycisphaerae bacterium]